LTPLARGGRRIRGLLGQRQAAIATVLATELIFFAVAAPGFATLQNIQTVLQSSSEIALLAGGMTLLIILGSVDVSVGSMLGIAAYIAGRLLVDGTSKPLVLLAVIAVGVVLGTFNGALVAFVGIPSIIVTLGTMSIFRAGVFWLLNGQFLVGIPSFSRSLAQGHLLWLPGSFAIALLVYGGLWHLLRHRVLGRRIYAIGNNEEAARLAGVNVRRTKLVSFALLGALTGLAALLYTMRVPSIEITVGQDFALLAIAAVVIGGASITGGSGSVVGTLLGVLFVGFLNNGLVIIGVPSLWELAVLGTFLLLSVGIDHTVERRRAAATRRAGREA
jgi:ribose transport system permease protein/AI-2 transport system permease protein